MDASAPIPGPNISFGEAFLPRRPVHDSKVYAERNASGAYDAIADQILAMGDDALANIDYTQQYTRHVEDWSKNHRFMDRTGNELRTAIVGEILGPAMGTLVRAHGNYFARDGDDPIDDKSKIKDTLALGPPTQSSTKLYNTFLNQVIGANQVVTSNANEDLRMGRHPIVKSWSKPGIEGSDTHNVLMVTMLPKYGVPSEAGIPKAATASKRRLDQVDVSVAPTAAVDDPDKPTYSGESTSFVSAFHLNVLVALDEDIKLGAFYEPSVLPDYGGAYFNHLKAKLVQLDVRDIHNELIPPWKFYDALRPGTLVLCLVSLHCFTMSDDGSKGAKERKIYQMNAHSIRVLSESDEPVEERTRPIAPNSPDRVIATIPKRAVAPSFANFSVPVIAPLAADSPTSSASGGTQDDMVLDDNLPDDKVVEDKPKKSKRAKKD
ncbi:hypothetical protein C8F04DRAFT_953370 [Mycena alexandri]|uniref:Uncharacterized protein n=1 Tax=Mycena alexandri TaxID=1745969 RepID=A0AAD6SZN4_9AGAR|nr:hypothetical protein C8F04DRAFT_953370 [Mycena alexandri]